MQHEASILITGGNGLVGRNLCAHLVDQGFANVYAPSSQDYDLRDHTAVTRLFEKFKPAYVFHLAGFVRGLMGNMKNQAVAYYDNVLINTNIVEACRAHQIKKIVAMGTVAMYPDPLPHIPLRESDLWQGSPHSSEYGYAMAKRGMLAHLQACSQQDGLAYACALSTNLYGPYDRFNTETGHVIPSLVKKFYDAAQSGQPVTVWGDGSAQRDFLYVKDAVTSLHLIMNSYNGVINIATGRTRDIKDAVATLARLSGVGNRILWDTNKPNGQVTRAYDVSILTGLGFSPAFTLETGLAETYDWYVANQHKARTT